jgi:hypothetical protein
MRGGRLFGLYPDKQNEEPVKTEIQKEVIVIDEIVEIPEFKFEIDKKYIEKQQELSEYTKVFQAQNDIPRNVYTFIGNGKTKYCLPKRGSNQKTGREKNLKNIIVDEGDYITFKPRSVDSMNMISNDPTLKHISNRIDSIDDIKEIKTYIFKKNNDKSNTEYNACENQTFLENLELAPDDLK